MPTKSQFSLVASGIISLGLFASLSHAAPYTLTHKNASLDLDTTSGLSNFTIDGVDHLASQNYYYRVGGVGGESPITSIGAPVVNLFVNASGSSVIDISYANATFSARTEFQLVGQNLGTGKAQLTESITIRNLTGANLDFHFFQYSDYDLGGIPGGQSVQFSQNSLNGQYYRVQQTLGSILLTSTVNTANPPIGHHEANLFANTLNSLTDANPTTLNDVAAAGVGDVTYAYQWDVLIAPGASFQLSRLTSIVPEPTTAALCGLALFALVCRSRRH